MDRRKVSRTEMTRPVPPRPETTRPESRRTEGKRTEAREARRTETPKRVRPAALAASEAANPAAEGHPAIRMQIAGFGLLLFALWILATLVLGFTVVDHPLGPWLGAWSFKFLVWLLGRAPAVLAGFVLVLLGARLVLGESPRLEKWGFATTALWGHLLLLLGLPELQSPQAAYAMYARGSGALGHLLVSSLFLPVFGPHRLGPVLVIATSFLATTLFALRVSPRDFLVRVIALGRHLGATIAAGWTELRARREQELEERAFVEGGALHATVEPRGRFIDRRIRPESEDGRPLPDDLSRLAAPGLAGAAGLALPGRAAASARTGADPAGPAGRARARRETPAAPASMASQASAGRTGATGARGAVPVDPEAELGEQALGVFRNLSEWRPLQPEDLVGLNPLEIRRLKERDEEVRKAAALNAWEDHEVRAEVSRRPRIAPLPAGPAQPESREVDATHPAEDLDLADAGSDGAEEAGGDDESAEELEVGSRRGARRLSAPDATYGAHPGESDGSDPENEEPPEPTRVPVKRAEIPRMKPARPAPPPRPAGKPLSAYRVPDLSILPDPTGEQPEPDEKELQELADRVVLQLKNFGVAGKVIQIEPGPVITRFKIELAPGTPVRKITNLGDDLAMTLRARRIRIVAPIPGESLVGIEIPNPKAELVFLKEILQAPAFRDPRLKLPVVLGKDITGHPVLTDLTRAPHLLIAGQTGSGKSVCINTIMSSILFSLSPERCRMILVDPKVVELAPYNEIPHLLAPVVTKPEEAVMALKWVAWEMDRRYEVLAMAGVRNIAGFNDKVAADQLPDTVPVEERAYMAYLVVVIDELADLMMVAGKEVETSVARIAQKARAVGIHMVLATQRPSTNVITGVIKANLPTRIAFQVASQIDARTILDRMGAEELLGRGDMLFRGIDQPEPTRVHGAFVSDSEAELIARAASSQGVDCPQLLSFDTGEEESDGEGEDDAPVRRDAKFAEAARLVVTIRQGSVSMLQRRMEIGFARAGRLMDQLERAGIVGRDRGSKPREVLMDELQVEDFLDRMENL